MNSKFQYLPYQYDFSRPGIFFYDDSRPDRCVGYQFPSVKYFLNDSSIVNLFGSNVSSELLDFIEIAFAVYLSDRVSPRDPRKHSNSNWIRTIILKVGVRCPEFWNQAEIREDLQNLLRFLTDDDWQIDFIPIDGPDRLFEAQRYLPMRTNSPCRVALFSGGLDSFAGSVSCMQNDRISDFVLVSGATNYRQMSLQRKQTYDLRRLERKGNIFHALVRFGIKWYESDETKQETSQRTRGFLFATLGCIAAVNAGSDVLEVYENGIGAINLPFDSSQISAMNSRSVHPITLIYLEKLVRKVIGRNFGIRNEFLFSTKGEMCRSLRIEMHDVITATFSCDGFPVHVTGKPQCGVCTSCLLRRLSLEAANLSEFDHSNHYLTDLAANESNPSLNQLNDLRAMEWHSEQLRACLGSIDPWRSLSIQFPDLSTLVAMLSEHRGINSERLQDKICRLFHKHCEEWTGFSARQHLLSSLRRAA